MLPLPRSILVRCTRHAPRDARPLAPRVSDPHAEREAYVTPRRGVTLIELMVVVSIMLMVTVIAVPAMKPALENRKIREAARSVNVYFGSARNHAIELGRPVGVLFTRDSTQANPCLELQQVEIPAPYAGDVIGNAASVAVTGATTLADGTINYTVQINFITFNPATNAPVAQPLLVAFHVGDTIQFGYQGLPYTIQSVSSTTPPISSATAKINLPPDYTLPWPTPPQGVPFQIARMPEFTTGVGTLATQSAVAPMQLPTGTAIDLISSGTNNGFWLGLAPASPVMLIFSPAGGVYGVYAQSPSGTPVSYGVVDPLYFLVGRRDRVFNVNLTGTGSAAIPQISTVATDILPNDGRANWQDTNNLWVTVTPQTGRITTGENAAVPYPYTAGTTNAQAIVLARGFALQGQSKGGR